MIPARKRIFILIFVVILLVCLLRILFQNSPMPILNNQPDYFRTEGAPVLLSVFYEALCPDSKYFLTKQVLPTFMAASSILKVHLFPYGKAKTSEKIEGKLTFDCQHGPTECQANIYHACVVNIIENPLVQLQLVTCMIQDNRFPQDAMLKCAKLHNITNTDLIEKCAGSTHGLELLKFNGEATFAIRPPVTFIPTVTIDGSQGRQASILKNLLSEVCKAAGDTENIINVCKYPNQ
ncbi:gamma-interferon-inducible lysosomal thiol reductase [Drosophila kikkawai]|uniref:Gamma-interferon-inducible lysosomal thiol reductase n=1 Tax=Drosophila kikkawai TaxID=30033 RepID=A0A6P4JG44_DROKI|nr:gamma-interferon-inducible lysosomal thiol reductase [Drosophila kikkawai]